MLKIIKPCPFCGNKIAESNMYIPERDWVPTYYDPDSGGEPIRIECECGLKFCIGTYNFEEFLESWNRRTNNEKT